MQGVQLCRGKGPPSSWKILDMKAASLNGLAGHLRCLRLTPMLVRLPRSLRWSQFNKNIGTGGERTISFWEEDVTLVLRVMTSHSRVGSYRLYSTRKIENCNEASLDERTPTNWVVLSQPVEVWSSLTLVSAILDKVSNGSGRSIRRTSHQTLRGHACSSVVEREVDTSRSWVRSPSCVLGRQAPDKSVIFGRWRRGFDSHRCPSRASGVTGSTLNPICYPICLSSSYLV